MGITVTRQCDHRRNYEVSYIYNDGKSAPVLLIQDGSFKGGIILSLTNQIIRVSCPTCFQDIRSKIVPRL